MYNDGDDPPVEYSAVVIIPPGFYNYISIGEALKAGVLSTQILPDPITWLRIMNFTPLLLEDGRIKWTIKYGIGGGGSAPANSHFHIRCDVTDHAQVRFFDMIGYGTQQLVDDVPSDFGYVEDITDLKYTVAIMDSVSLFVPQYNWNDAVFINASIAEGNSVERQESKDSAIGSTLCVIPLNVPHGCSKVQINEDYHTHSVIYNSTHSISDIRIQLKNKYGYRQQLPGNHISVIVAKLSNINV
jgi:hypothetical protein|tara:strand:+ start:7242 stop:7970 length:729 start_codon:yes stop_codon:yes gene_type:complete